MSLKEVTQEKLYSTHKLLVFLRTLRLTRPVVKVHGCTGDPRACASPYRSEGSCNKESN